VTPPDLEDRIGSQPQRPPAAGLGWPSTAGLVASQIRYQLRLFWRVPVALFFTLALPLVMLVVFNAMFGSATVTIDGGQWPVRQFYTAGLAVFTAVSATYTNLANMVPIRRDEGVLKRWKGTPLPTWIYVAGAIGSAVVLAVIGVVIMLGLGVVAYGLEVEAAKMPAAILTFVVGVGAFAALGMAVAAVVPTASAASAVANATILPLAFISNVFIVIEEPPRLLGLLGDAFPLKPFVTSFQEAFNPLVEAPAINWGNLGFIAAWGLVGLVVAVRRFRWEPSSGGTTRRRRSQRRAAAAQG
jgi:ABC-2 type transport system permease protein